MLPRLHRTARRPLLTFVGLLALPFVATPGAVFLLPGALTAQVTPQVTPQPTQGTLVVQVRSEAGPVRGAEVRVEGPEVREDGIRAMTDDRGEVRLELPEGEVRIEVHASGFPDAIARARITRGEETRVVMELHTEMVEARGIVVTSTRIGRRVQDEPLRVEVLDREEIEEKTLMTPGNIVMLLNETGGLRVQVTSPSLGAANIRVQGMRGRYTLLLADGLPLFGGQAGAIGLLQIPPTDLGQVEVIKGVASALYGGSALGGVINLISREPSEELAAEFLANTTSHGGQDLTGYLSGPISDLWGWSLTTGAHRQTQRDLDDRGWADVPSHRRWTARPRLHFEDGEGRSALVTLGAMTEGRTGGTLPGRVLPEGTPFVESLDTDRLDGGFTGRLPVGDSRFLGLRASAMIQDHRHSFGTFEERDRHDTGFVEAALSGVAGVHTWVLGGALQRDGYRSETFPTFDYAFTVPSLFAQNEVGLTRDLVLSGSARWDGHSEYGSQVSPRLSALYRPGDWTVRTSAGGGFFAPTPFTEEIEAAGLARLMPPEGLRVERARNASVDVGRTVGPIEVNATLFGSRVRDAVQLLAVDQPEGGPVTGPVPGPVTGLEGGHHAGHAAVRLANVEGETRTAGAELLVRYRWDDFSVTGSWVFVRATEPVAGSQDRRNVPLTPRQTGGLVAMWEDHDRGLLGVEAYFTGRQPLDDNPFREEGRRHVHLGILGELRLGVVQLGALRLGALSAFLNAENLLDVRQTRFDPLVRDRRAPDGRWTVDAWAPLEGFVVNGGIRIRLGGGDHHDDDHHH